MKDVYGFKVIDNLGGYLIRWFNSNGVHSLNKTKGLEEVTQYQQDLSFELAYQYVKDIANKKNWKFITLTEEDFNDIDNPLEDVVDFIRNIFKKKKKNE